MIAINPDVLYRALEDGVCVRSNEGFSVYHRVESANSVGLTLDDGSLCVYEGYGTVWSVSKKD